MHSILQKHCFKWDHLQSLYLAPDHKQRFLEECLMQKEIDYYSEKKKVALCEICKPTITTINTNELVVGFSNKIHYFRLFGIELISLYALFEKAKERIKNNLDKITLEEIIKLKEAKTKLFQNSNFDRGFMLCSDCIASKNKIKNFLKEYAWHRIQEYSTLLNPDEENLNILAKEVQIYYNPTIPL